MSCHVAVAGLLTLGTLSSSPVQCGLPSCGSSAVCRTRSPRVVLTLVGTHGHIHCQHHWASSGPPVLGWAGTGKTHQAASGVFSVVAEQDHSNKSVRCPGMSGRRRSHSGHLCASEVLQMSLPGSSISQKWAIPQGGGGSWECSPADPCVATPAIDLRSYVATVSPGSSPQQLLGSALDVPGPTC